MNINCFPQAYNPPANYGAPYPSNGYGAFPVNYYYNNIPVAVGKSGKIKIKSVKVKSIKLKSNAVAYAPYPVYGAPYPVNGYNPYPVNGYNPYPVNGYNPYPCNGYTG